MSFPEEMPFGNALSLLYTDNTAMGLPCTDTTAAMTPSAADVLVRYISRHATLHTVIILNTVATSMLAVHEALMGQV